MNIELFEYSNIANEDEFFVQSEYSLYMQRFYFGGSNRLIGGHSFCS